MANQVVMTGSTWMQEERIWISELIFPFYASILSAFSLLFHLAVVKVNAKWKGTRNAEVTSSSSGQRPSFSEHVSAHGGRVIFAFNVARLGCTLGLFALSFTSLFVPMNSNRTFGDVRLGLFGICFTFAYGSFLALASVFMNPGWSRIIIRHLNIVLLVSFAVYAYRDLYPLGTFNRVPLDGSPLIWSQIVLLAIVSIFIPLLVPRQYTPVDPKNPAPVPNPEQTASLLSYALCAFMDHVILKARRGEHMPYDELPPLADYDSAENLWKHAFRHIDPTSQPKRRFILFPLLRIFSKELFIITVAMTVEALAGFGSPIAVNNLLSFLQTDGEGHVIRPWAWILLLFLGPTINTIAVEQYVFTVTRLGVNMESILTQLIFEHALRIRLKSSTDNKVVGTAKGEPSTTTSSASTSTSQRPASVSSDATVTPTQEDASSSQSSDTNKAGQKAAEPKPSDSEANKNLIGKLNNLVSTDLQTIVDAKDLGRVVVFAPIKIALSVTFLYWVLGWSAFIGLAAMIITLPIPGLIGKFIGKFQAGRMKQTDARVQVVSEVMSVLRMVKMFGWEKRMYERISDKREQELAYIWKMRMLNVFTIITNYVIPICTMLATYGSYTLIMKEQLSAAKVFSSMVVFDQFENQLRTVLQCLNSSAAAKVSLDRITTFLYETELLDAYSKSPETEDNSLARLDEENSKIGFRNVTFSWSSYTGYETPNSRQFLLRIENELLFKKGVINLIIGPTGSGKTSLLMALLSEMHFIPNSLDSWYNLPREGGVAYAAQESWVQNATIRDNIVFGSAFDEVRYKKVLHQCCLERDLSLFAAGDDTEVGEKGLTLSGGQKARVTLARAVYSQADILILDDVLAALDVHTAKWIVQKCFQGDLLKGRTVILVTHNVVMMQPLAGFVISMKDGKVSSQGNVNDALVEDEILAAEVEKEKEIEEREGELVDDAPKDIPKDGKLILPEEVEIGRLSWPALKLFLTGLGGEHFILFFAVFSGLYFVADIAESGQTWYLGYWAHQYDERPPEDVNAARYIGFYSLFLLVVIVGNVGGLIFYTYGSLRASRSIHQQLVQSILGSTMRWLDQTPTSRVITRVTQDIRDVDDPVSQTLAGLVGYTTTMIIKFCAVILFTPVFLLPALFITILGGSLGRLYIRAQMSVKREVANAKAPVLGHFGAAITGLVSIRAYGVQESFRRESRARIDHYSRPARTFWNLNRWVNIRIGFIANIFTTSLATYLVYLGHQNPSNTGYTLNMAVGFSGRILWWIRILNLFETRGNSLERINRYLHIEQEPKPTPEGKPPAYWPSSGDLKVEELSARYSPEGPKVLKDITFHVKSGERIGVVGRTGSGKSSLMLSLLRCIPTEGNVYYDGLLTNSMNLEDLRSHITIIPQMPELLTGTVRENLDPFDQHDDAALNDALRAAGLFSLQEESEEDRITLDSPIASGGGNLSVGQRQILALARAMVRGSKLFILDEATSAIDYKTDAVIQKALRQELGKDVTLITVAHRLQTIMDADRIMVLDAGSIVEFDSPQELLKIPGGKLRALVDESADKEHLHSMVQSSG